MKRRIQDISIGVIITMLLLGAVNAFASTSRTITATYGINVVVDGVKQNFTEDMQPFMTGGRTFLPVRGIAEALGAEVTWERETSTVYVKSPAVAGVAPTPTPPPTPTPKPEPAPFFETFTAFDGKGLSVRSVNIQGTAYNNALRTSEHHREIPSSGWSQHHISERYTTLTGLIGCIDGSPTSMASTVTFIGDGNQLATFIVDSANRMTPITVDVTGVSELRIQIDQPSNGGVWVAFADAIIE